MLEQRVRDGLACLARLDDFDEDDALLSHAFEPIRQLREIVADRTVKP